MQVREMLEATQPIVMQTLRQAFKEQRTSHAYLISGQKGTPCKEMAIFLAQSFVCNQPDSLACEECLDCHRIANGAYSNLIFLNAKETDLSVSTIESIALSLNKVSLENKGKKIYIIHLFEKCKSAAAANTLLKFLEEPPADTIAIITTENQNELLPTIVSRCQILRLKPIEKNILINRHVSKGMPLEDASILCENHYEEEEVSNLFSNGQYNTIKDLVIDTIRVMVENPAEINYFEMSEINPYICAKNESFNPKDKCALFLDLLGIALQDVIKLSLGQEIIYNSQKSLISKLATMHYDIADIVCKIMIAESQIEKNANIGLLIDGIFYAIRQKGSDK